MAPLINIGYFTLKGLTDMVSFKVNQATTMTTAAIARLNIVQKRQAWNRIGIRIRISIYAQKRQAYKL